MAFPTTFESTHPWLTTITATSVFLLTILLLRMLHKQTSRRCPLPPGSTGLPLVGETFDYLRCYRANKASEFVQVRKSKYGDVFQTSLLFNRTVVLVGAEANHFLFSNEGKLVRLAWPTSVLKLLGEQSLGGLSGLQHKRLRRLVMPCFYPDVLQKVVAKVDVLTQQHFTQKWQAQLQITLYPLVKSHVLDVASSLLIGVEDGETRDEFAKLFKTFVAGLLSLPVYLPWTRYYKAHAARTGLTKILNERILERRKEIETGRQSVDHELKDPLSTLITAKDEYGKPLSQEQTVDMIISFLFAGHETITSTLSFFCKFLCENPTCYDEVLKEQTAIAESKKHAERLTWEDLVQKMKYTWTVIHETMRMQPAVNSSFRVALKDFEYGGYRIPRGWTIFTSVANMHMDERYFPDPKRFDPSRFAGTGPTPYSYIPFGGGPHICAGIEFARMVILVYAHHLVRGFKWALVNPMEHVCIDPIPLPVEGFPIILEERKM